MKSIKTYIKEAIQHPTKVVRKLDKIFMGGLMRKCWRKRKEKKLIEEEIFRREHPEEWYDQTSVANRHKYPIIGYQTVSCKDIVLAQFSEGQCVFYDIVIRLLAIDQYYGKNTLGYDLYSRLQASSGSFWLSRFQKLIKSVEDNGLSLREPIELTQEYKIFDGAHRLALAIYHNIEELPVVIYDAYRDRPYSYNLLWEINCSKEEILLIQEKAKELFNYCKYDYVGVVWPPAFHLRDEIIQEINNYSHEYLCTPLQTDDCRVVKYVDLHLDKNNFAGFLRAMYYTDILNEDGVKWKLTYMDNGMPEGSVDYPVRIFYLNLSNPGIRRNEKNNSAQSTQISRIKKVIRSEFKDRVRNYQYDIAMHISDNYIQSKFCDVVTKIDKDISDLFLQLNEQYNYVVIKANGRQSKNLPYDINYHSDVDILVNKCDVKNSADFAEKWLNIKYGKENENWVTIERIKDEEEQVEIQVALRGWMFFLVHIQTVKYFNMRHEFGDDCLSNKVKSANNMVWILPNNYDILFRAVELIRKPYKLWHKDYIENHLNEYDEKLAINAYGQDSDIFAQVQQLMLNLKTQ